MSDLTAILPDRFTLTVERSPTGMWFVTSDAHRGYLHAVADGAELPRGLSEVPAGLAEILTAQAEADAGKTA